MNPSGQIPRSPLRQIGGSVLVITLFIALLLGMVLTSYLLLIRAQNVSVARSQAWHTALTAAEAGVEEALAQLNVAPLTTNLSFDLAWRSESGGYVLDQPRNLNVGPNLAGNSYAVRLASAVPPTASAIIYATGYANVPAISATLTRTLEVVTTNAPLFTVGAVVRDGLNLNGYNFMADSYDSDSWPYKYDPNNRKQNGDVASTLGILNAASVDILGRLFLGATATNNPAPEFDVLSDFNADFPEVTTPALPGNVNPPDSRYGYDYYLDRSQHRATSLNGSVRVKDNVNTVLYVTGDVNITNLRIGDNASLKLYVSGGSTSLGPMFVAASASAFQYYGLPGNTNIALAGTTNFIGTIYAPNARLTAVGGTSALDFQGALVVKSADLFKHFRLHYDENLQRAPVRGPLRGFIVTSWREL
ncbi:MAG: hypothetical protein IH623_31725 [Verrucomicrobia bacterium]|nr:hypothetical protein [Verrucomicrobiota bacterium]